MIYVSRFVNVDPLIGIETSSIDIETSSRTKSAFVPRVQTPYNYPEGGHFSLVKRFAKRFQQAITGL